MHTPAGSPLPEGLFERLVRLVQAGSRCLGPGFACPVVRPGAIGLQGTNVDIWWMQDALGEGRPGWRVLETDHVFDLLGGGERLVSRTVVSLPPREVYAAARAALLAAAERRLEIAFEAA